MNKFLSHIEKLAASPGEIIRGAISPAWMQSNIAKKHGTETGRNAGQTFADHVGGEARQALRSGAESAVGGAVGGAVGKLVKGQGGALVGAALGSTIGAVHGYYRSTANQANEAHKKYSDHEKKAAFDALIEHGVDFDTAIDLIEKEAGSKLDALKGAGKAAGKFVKDLTGANLAKAKSNLSVAKADRKLGDFDYSQKDFPRAHNFVKAKGSTAKFENVKVMPGDKPAGRLPGYVKVQPGRVTDKITNVPGATKNVKGKIENVREAASDTAKARAATAKVGLVGGAAVGGAAVGAAAADHEKKAGLFGSLRAGAAAATRKIGADASKVGGQFNQLKTGKTTLQGGRFSVPISQGGRVDAAKQLAGNAAVQAGAGGVAGAAAIGAGVGAAMNRPREKKACVEALMAQGIDFYTAVELTKQAEKEVYGE